MDSIWFFFFCFLFDLIDVNSVSLFFFSHSRISDLSLDTWINYLIQLNRNCFLNRNGIRCFGIRQSNRYLPNYFFFGVFVLFCLVIPDLVLMKCHRFPLMNLLKYFRNVDECEMILFRHYSLYRDDVIILFQFPRWNKIECFDVCK